MDGAVVGAVVSNVVEGALEGALEGDIDCAAVGSSVAVGSPVEVGDRDGAIELVGASVVAVGATLGAVEGCVDGAKEGDADSPGGKGTGGDVWSSTDGAFDGAPVIVGAEDRDGAKLIEGANEVLGESDGGMEFSDMHSSASKKGSHVKAQSVRFA